MSFSTRLKAIALMRISRLKAYIYSKRLRKPTNNSASGGARQACQAPVDSEQASPVSELQVGPAFAPYDQDGLFSIHNHEFMADPDFIRAYARGVKAVGGVDYQWHWRVHVGLWAAANAAKRPGDFVECGVNRGFLSSSMMALLDWDKTERTFYLLDTFRGIDERYVSDAEKALGVLKRNADEIKSGFYTLDVDEVRRNFAEWKNVKIIVGSIPETLVEIASTLIAFLHIDLNCSPPEVAAADALWDRICPGEIVLLDDYAYHGYRTQKLGMDEFAKRKGVTILSLPTGQGLIIKPPC